MLFLANRSDIDILFLFKVEYNEIKTYTKEGVQLVLSSLSLGFESSPSRMQFLLLACLQHLTISDVLSACSVVVHVEITCNLVPRAR